MVGNIITAREAVQKYPGKAEFRGSKVVIKNADCQTQEIDPDQEVYHRKHGCFGIVTDTKDRGAHWSWGSRKRGAHNKVKGNDIFSSSDIYGI